MARADCTKLAEQYRQKLKSGNYEWVIGADECGTGAWAGPAQVCAAAVPARWMLDGLKDSKKLSEPKREELFPLLHSQLEYVYELTQPSEIEKLGLHDVLRHSYTLLVDSLLEHFPGALVVIDGDMPFYEGGDALFLPKADTFVPAVSAASVLGKVIRDRVMRAYDEVYPLYAFGESKGYGTGDHIKALNEHGPCEIHRRSYAPIKKLLFNARQIPLPIEGIRDPWGRSQKSLTATVRELTQNKR